MQKVIKVRICVARKDLIDKTFSLFNELRLRFVHATDETIMFYGCESLTLTKYKATKGFLMDATQKCCNVLWRDHMTAELQNYMC